MEKELNVNFNVFLSCDYNNGNTAEIHTDLTEYFEKNNEIIIIDPPEKYSLTFNEGLCEIVLKQIDDAEIFICILTPYYNDEKKEYIINNNVLIELGYAISQKKWENVYIFIHDGSDEKFNLLKPTMLMHVKYMKYNDKNDIIDFIEEKYIDFENNDNSFYNKKEINDKYLLSLIKYDLIKILKEKMTTKQKIKKIDNILDNYYNDDIFQIFFDFSVDYISVYQSDHKYIDYCFHKINELEYFEWKNKKNNQKKILNFLNMFNHILFRKFGLLKTNEINNNRKNFILLLFELLKSNNFLYNDNIKNIINNSLNDSKHNDYNLYVYNLNGLYKNILYDNKINKNKEYWEDLIFESQNEIFKTFIIDIY
jgi:hypothetical protein